MVHWVTSERCGSLADSGGWSYSSAQGQRFVCGPGEHSWMLRTKVSFSDGNEIKRKKESTKGRRDKDGSEKGAHFHPSLSVFRKPFLPTVCWFMVIVMLYCRFCLCQMELGHFFFFFFWSRHSLVKVPPPHPPVLWKPKRKVDGQGLLKSVPDKSKHPKGFLTGSLKTRHYLTFKKKKHLSCTDSRIKSNFQLCVSPTHKEVQQ